MCTTTVLGVHAYVAALAVLDCIELCICIKVAYIYNRAVNICCSNLTLNCISLEVASFENEVNRECIAVLVLFTVDDNTGSSVVCAKN